jgi:hypothetical protein
MLEARWREFGARVTPGERFSISETYTNVPAAMSRSGDGRVAWTCRLNAPSVHFERSASTDVDLYMEADYEAIIALVRFVVTPDNQNEYQRVAQQAMADHRIRTVGDLGRAAFAQELHNEVAERTC